MNRSLVPAAILAGGLATRLGELTRTIPKSMIDIHGEPFIAHQLRLLRHRGFERIVLCLGHYGQQIEQFVRDQGSFGLDVRCVYDGQRPLGTAGALRQALPDLGERFFVLYGDSYLECDYQAVQAAFDESGRDALMTVYRNDGLYDTSNVEFDAGGIVAYDKTRRTMGMHHIDYGLGVFLKGAFDLVPVDEPYDLAKLYQELLGQGRLAAFEVLERFYEIGSVAGLEETRRRLSTLA